jgi:DNA-binding protein H-NS
MSPELKQMQAQLAKLTAAIQERQAFERSQVLGQIAELMYANEVTLEELQQSLKPARKKATRKLKAPEVVYKDPNSGAVWSGRGREPKWIQGQDRDQFAIAA